MSYLNCLILMQKLLKTQFAGVNLTTAIPARRLVEQGLSYNVNDDLYYYNQTNFNMYLLGPGGTQTLVGAAT